MLVHPAINLLLISCAVSLRFRDSSFAIVDLPTPQGPDLLSYLPILFTLFHNNSLFSYHSATVPSLWRQTGFLQRCPTCAIFRTYSSLIVMPSPGPCGICTYPSL